MREKLDEVLRKIQGARIDVEQMKAEQKLCLETFGVVMKLRDHPPFWPKHFDVNAFVKLEGDLLALDATIEIATQRLAAATGMAKDIAQYIKLSEMYSRQSITPPTGKNGQTLDDAVDEAHGDAIAALEDVPVLRAEIDGVISDMRSLLG